MGKPLAGQLGQMGSQTQSQMGSQTQSQMGGGFGGSQPQLRQPALQSPYNGSGGGGMQLPGMGAFQDFMRQQQMGQQAPQMSAPQQPAYGGFGNGIGINIAQPPQSGTQAMPQQDMLNAQQQAFAQMQQQMPQQPMSQMGQQNLIGMLQGMGNKLGSTGQPLGEEGFGPAGSRPQQQMNPMQSQVPQYLPTQMDALRQQQQMSQQAPQQPMQQTNPMQSQMDALRQQQQMSQQAPQQPMQQMSQQAPQMPLRAPQQVRPEPPRMQAMRGIQRLANRQRGYNR